MAIWATGKTGTIGKELSKSVTPLLVDLNEIDRIRLPEEMKSGDILIHLGGIVGERSVSRDFVTARRVNVTGTLKLAEQAKSIGAKFVYVSSSHVYASQSRPIVETDDLEPSGNYANLKLEAEQELNQLFNSDTNALLILRVFSLLDWGMKIDSLGGRVEYLLRSDVRFQITHGLDVMDFLTPRQCADIIERIIPLNLNGILNICSGKGQTVAEAVDMLVATRSARRLDKSNTTSDKPYIVGDCRKFLTVTKMASLDWAHSPSQ
jgi:UDP-glucose 4-epimerase/GDP-4-dehydro-6-deoxy-D-mannose reductase